jgi:hypothetical protein
VADSSPPVQIPEPDNAVAQRLARVVGSLADGDHEQAARHLEPLVGVTCRTSLIDPMPMLPRDHWPQGQGAKTRNPPIPVIAVVYLRDGFACLYCGRWTVPPQILRLISCAFPQEFPYHRNWRMDIAPRAYWDISTSIDHVHAVSTGGDWQDPSNLATACARCQYQKSNLPIEALGWTIRRDHGTWDGLTSEYEALWDQLGRPEEREHAPWIRSFGRA